MIEETTVRFLKLSRERGISVTGPMLQTLVREEAKRIGVQPIEAFDGWLARVKERHVHFRGLVA